MRSNYVVSTEEAFRDLLARYRARGGHENPQLREVVARVAGRDLDGAGRPDALGLAPADPP
jgi:hypothetical protein